MSKQLPSSLQNPRFAPIPKEGAFGDTVVVQLPSRVRLFTAQWPAACQASLSLTISQSLPKFMSIASAMPSSHLILWYPLLLPSIFPIIRVFSNESVHIRWPKCWSFSSSISPSHDYSGLISFMIDWFDLLAVQGTLRSLLQHLILKVSVLWFGDIIRPNRIMWWESLQLCLPLCDPVD